MSFSSDLKTEILENKALRSRHKKAQAYGLFAFSKSFTVSSVSISTENEGTAKLFLWFLKHFLGGGVDAATGEITGGGKTIYTVKLNERADRERLLGEFGHEEGRVNRSVLPTPAHLGAFLSGAYLACGNITDPRKSYHIEFVVKDEGLCGGLKSLLDECLPGAKQAKRRGNFVVYYKEYSQIEDLLTIMGASRSCLAMIDVEMIKGARNNANRAANCENANIDKLVEASMSQIEDIKLVLSSVGEEDLPEHLREIARLRLENPDASLRELAALLQPAMSRSGIHHRLERLSRIAAEIRTESGNRAKGWSYK